MWSDVHKTLAKLPNKHCSCSSNNNLNIFSASTNNFSFICKYTEAMQSDTSIEMLPGDVLRLIMRFLPYASLVSYMCVSPRFFASTKLVLARARPSCKDCLIDLGGCGSLGLIKWFHNFLKYPLLDTKFVEPLLSAAVEGGQLETVNYLLDFISCKCEPYYGHFCGVAARAGHLEILKLLRARGWPWDAYTCNMAASRGKLDVLQWARANGCEWNKLFICSYAASGGHIPVLQWAESNGALLSCHTCAAAANGGQLSVLKWLHEVRHADWDEKVCENAASGGHLEILKWARAKRCPWNTRVCENAAGGGHLTLLQWARANGCPWDGRVIKAALRRGHTEVRRWALANGCDDAYDYDL